MQRSSLPPGGAVAQLGERLVRNEEVRGSNPLGSTKHLALTQNKGRPSVTRSFLLKSDADAWARLQELDADRLALPTAHKGLRGITVADLVTRYRDEIVPKKRAGDREAQMHAI